jgi:hypothetical protein
MFVLCVLLLVSVRPEKLRAADEPAAIAGLLKAPDFWSRTGARLSHPEISGQDLSSISDLAGTFADAAVRIRAYKLLADSKGWTRYSEPVAESQALEAAEAAFWYLERHLDDKAVAQFHPELGFTHVTLSQKAGDDGALWLLIETADGVSPSGGLNVRWDQAGKTVDKVEHWGATRKSSPLAPAR